MPDAQFALVSVADDSARADHFRAVNPHFALTHAAICPEGDVNREAMLRDGLITPDNRFDRNALARAQCHVMLWRLCAESGRTTHIADDIVVIRDDFHDAIAPHLAGPAGFDVLVWGYDLAGPVQIHYAPGVEGRLIHHQTAARPNLDAFRQDRTATRMFRLLHCGAPCGYTLSPAGARALLDRCLPFTAAPLPYFSDPTRLFGNLGFDREMARRYPKLAAHVLQPVLAVIPERVALDNVARHYDIAFKEFRNRSVVPPLEVW